MRVGFLSLALCLSVFADDALLNALRTGLVTMRARTRDSAAPRGATAELTVTKHRLRDWIEERLGGLSQRPDLVEFERQANAELRRAALSCGFTETNSSTCPQEDFAGFLDAVEVQLSQGFLVIITGVGIECGFDHSVYVYSWSGEKWLRVWQNEQNTYTVKDYTPQNLHAVLISPYNHENDYLILTLGSLPWCSSNWHRVYYRVFRMGPDLQSAPLVNGAADAYLGSHHPPIQGSVSSNDVLVEFTTGSIDSGVHSRQAVRHYNITKTGAKRLEPVALSPRDFVDEWLVTDWRETAQWSEDRDRASMRQWYDKLRKITAEFIYPTMHCATSPDLWQVGLQDLETSTGAKFASAYFLVRWRPPYRFSMVGISNAPYPSCRQPDPSADARRTLFPVQSWR